MRNWEVAFFWMLIPICWAVLLIMPISVPWVLMAFASLMIETIWVLVRLEQKRLILEERNALIRERQRKRLEQFTSRRWLDPPNGPYDQTW